jgi:creatinine amidohydrolase
MKINPLILEEMTMSDFEEAVKVTNTILIPFGSVEEHGNHLPLSTDTLQAYEVGKKASSKVHLFVAPPVHYGYCRSTSCHPGTISISTATLKAIMKDVIRSCHSHGLTNFIILTGHAGGSQRMALQEAGEELIAEYENIRIAVLTEFQIASTVGSGIIETPNDQHAGEIETSRIMHSHPHLVKGEGKKEFPNFPEGILVKDKRKYWPDGIWGDPTRASGEKGKLIEEMVVERVIEFVKQFEVDS